MKKTIKFMKDIAYLSLGGLALMLFILLIAAFVTAVFSASNEFELIACVAMFMPVFGSYIVTIKEVCTKLSGKNTSEMLVDNKLSV